MIAGQGTLHEALVGLVEDEDVNERARDHGAPGVKGMLKFVERGDRGHARGLLTTRRQKTAARLRR